MLILTIIDSDNDTLRRPGSEGSDYAPAPRREVIPDAVDHFLGAP